MVFVLINPSTLCQCPFCGLCLFAQLSIMSSAKHDYPFAAHVERSAHLDAIAALMEEELRVRAKLISDGHRMYSIVAHRFVTLLEADMAAARGQLAVHSVVPQYHHLEQHGTALPSTPSSRVAGLTTPRRLGASLRLSDSDSDDDLLPPGPPPRRDEASPHHHSLFLSATKLDQTDARLVPTHSKSPLRTGNKKSASALEDRRQQSVAHVTLSNQYQTKRRECTIRRLDQQVVGHAAVVSEFQEREAKRVEAFRRREASLLKKAMDNEARNAVAATERGRLALKHFDATKPLRLHVETKGEASRVSLKKNLLRDQATARAARRMDHDTRQFVAEKEKQFEQHMASLQEIAVAAHHQQIVDCSHSKAMLGSVLANRNAKQGRYQRVFHQHMSGVLSARKRQDYDDISGVVRARFAEPIGVEVTWSSDDEEAVENRAGIATALFGSPKLRKPTTSASKAMSEEKYARFCGPTESAVRGIAGLSAAPGVASPSLFNDMISPVIRGATHVGWR